MKIIFLKDVPRVGQRGQIKNVADGYGNSLISRGIAERATPGAINKINKNKQIEKENKKKRSDDFKTFLENVNNLNIVINMKANEKGHLFQSVSRDDVLKEIKGKVSFDIDSKMIEVGHIKEIGKHPVKFSYENNFGECYITIDKK